VVAWKDTTLLHLTAKYSPKDIFIVDEFGVLYNMLPEKHTHSKEQAAKA
jgi:hypothetical protein